MDIPCTLHRAHGLELFRTEGGLPGGKLRSPGFVTGELVLPVELLVSELLRSSGNGGIPMVIVGGDTWAQHSVMTTS